MRWIIALLALLFAAPAYAAEGDRIAIVKSTNNRPFQVISSLCETASIGGTCAEFDMASGARSLPASFSVKLESESGGTCTVTVSGRDITATGSLAELGTLTTAGTIEEKYSGNHRYLVASIAGTCTAIDVRVKRNFE